MKWLLLFCACVPVSMCVHYVHEVRGRHHRLSARSTQVSGPGGETAGKAPPLLRCASRHRERGSGWRAGRLLRMRSALARLWRPGVAVAVASRCLLSGRASGRMEPLDELDLLLLEEDGGAEAAPRVEL